MTKIDKRLWIVVTTTRNEANYCLSVSGSPFSSFPSLPMCLAIHGEQRHQLRGPPSVKTFYPAQLLVNGMDAKFVCSFYLKTNGALLRSTHSSIFCNTPMHAWCGFCSCGKQELGDGCCFRRICRSCIAGRQQQTIESVQQPLATVQQAILPMSARKRAQEWIGNSSGKDLMSCSDKDSDYKQETCDEEREGWESGGKI